MAQISGAETNVQLQRKLVFPLIPVLVGLLLVACGFNAAHESQPTPNLEETEEGLQEPQDGALDAQMRQSIENTLALLLTPVPTPTVTPATGPSPAASAGLTPASGKATLTVVDIGAAPGQQVTLPILLDTGGTGVRSVQVNLAYDSAKLSNPVGLKNSEALSSWSFTSHSPQPGDLRLLALSSTGNGETFAGQIFRVTFNVDANVPVGDVLISVAEKDVRDESNLALDVSVITGAVTVTP